MIWMGKKILYLCDMSERGIYDAYIGRRLEISGLNSGYVLVNIQEYAREHGLSLRRKSGKKSFL